MISILIFMILLQLFLSLNLPVFFQYINKFLTVVKLNSY